MTRLYGWAPKGQRLVGVAPRGHWQTTTMLCGVRSDRVTAPLAIDGPMDGVVFLGYVQQCLAPSLRAGDVVVMDNLSSHKAAGVRQAIEAAGAEVWYLPPYSPDLNPIENLWSKVKAHLRSAQARSFSSLIRAIGSALRSVTAQDCRGFFNHCGYPYTQA